MFHLGGMSDILRQPVRGCPASHERTRSVSARSIVFRPPPEIGKEMFKTGQNVPESGIYRVVHAEHRLPHEVTLLRGEAFPRCAKCADQVEFEPVSLAPS